MSAPDPRLTPARADLAASHLQGEITAPRYVEGATRVVRAPSTELLRAPDGGLDTELLFGEAFTVYDTQEGWAWGQAALDGYVGYVRAADLAEPEGAATHRVTTLGAHLYPAAELKTRPVGRLLFGARLTVHETTQSHARVSDDAWVALPQIAPLCAIAPDFVTVAEQFLGVPYLWGGRSSRGLDCSGLVQLSLQAAGQPCPRDSDMQASGLGSDLAPGTPLKRGDLVFWRGHVGIMADGETLLHANAHHMAVAREPFAQACARIAKAEFGEVTRLARLDAPRGSA